MYPRNIATRLLDSLADTPVILLNGARQTGKSTLIEWLTQQGYPLTSYTLDNLTLLASVKADPEGFINNMTGSVAIDEIQKAPELFPVIKESVDKNRKPGRFLLTGSTNVMLLPQLSESLAGRMEILNLWPLSQGEIHYNKENFLDCVFAKEFKISKCELVTRDELLDRLLKGGYPEVLERPSAQRRYAWFESYITAILQRDVRDIANIEGIAMLPRLLSLLATRSASLMNYAELSRTSTIPHSTLMRYFTLLQATFLIYTVPAWSNHLGKRLVKAPKLFLNDTGLLAYLMGLEKTRLEQEPNSIGMLLENFVVGELKKQQTWSETITQMFHYRTQRGEEVDTIIENLAGYCVGIEIKAKKAVTEKDFKGLKELKLQLGNKFIRGIVLYTGDAILPFGEELYAMPVSSIWSRLN